MDLRSWDFTNNGDVFLRGEWEFYWLQQIDPTQKSPEYKEHKVVPHLWQKLTYKKKKLKTDGYASYRLRFTVKEINQLYAFRIGIQNTAYQIYANGKKIGSVGTFGKNKSQSIPSYKPSVFPVYLTKPEVDVVIHISNYHNRYGGMRTTIEFGLLQNVTSNREIALATDLMASGGLLIIAFYHFFLFVLRKQDPANLMVLLYSLMYGIKTLLEQERFLISVFPYISLEADLSISYIITFLSTGVFSSFMYWTFPGLFHKKFLRFIQTIALILSSIVLLTPVAIYSRIAVYHQIYLVIVALYGFFVLIKAIRSKRDGSIVLSIGFILFFLMAVVNDSLYSSGIIQSVYLAGYAFLLFLFSQGMVLAIKSANAFRSEEKLKLSLEETNKVFSFFVPKGFLQLLHKKSIKDVTLGNYSQGTMSILFCDIRSFTSLSETMSPEDNFRFLNSYLRYIAPVIENNEGLIDKFIGDAIMAIFPENTNHPDNALKAALDIQANLKIYNQYRQNSGYEPIEISIGVNTGPVILGTVGYAERMDTTVIGDSVNLASRLEHLTREYNVPLLVSEYTVENLKNRDSFNLQKIDSVFVKGKAIPVTIYECYNTIK
ncbi:MAG: adenylate/guanylate cyclase domain-containing protein [Spirochaetota bacterium]